MATLHLFANCSLRERGLAGCLGGSRASADGLAHLLGMDSTTNIEDLTDRSMLTRVEQVISPSELCAHLNVTAQTIYDLRSQGRGPRGFRVGLMPGRPRTPIGTSGAVNIRRRGKSVMAEARFRDADGRLRRVSASAQSAAAARRHLISGFMCSRRSSTTRSRRSPPAGSSGS